MKKDNLHNTSLSRNDTRKKSTAFGEYVYIALCLLICLFIYLFYRTEQTVINQIFIALTSKETLFVIKESVTAALPLSKFIVYSLPEGLWVFCITLTSKSLFVTIGRREIDLIFVPLLLAITWEFLQLFHVTNGYFDFIDIGFSILFWIIAKYVIKDNNQRQNIIKPFNIRSFICIFSYAIIYLSHVCQ